MNVNGKICETLYEKFENTNKHRKLLQNENDSQFEDYRDINQNEKSKYFNDELGKLPLHEKLQKPKPNNDMMDFEATSFCPSAMCDRKPLYPKIESVVAFNLYMNGVYVEDFNNQSFNQDGNESAVFKIKYYNPLDLIFQHFPVTERVENVVNRMGNGYIVDTLTCVDFQAIIKIGGKVIRIYEGVIYRENFKKSAFR